VIQRDVALRAVVQIRVVVVAAAEDKFADVVGAALHLFEHFSFCLS
jgi:hypothetical protein